VFIHAMDPARRSGYAIGEAGERPRQGFLVLRQPKEDRAVACGNLIAYLQMVWTQRKPDLFLYEPPMSLAAWIANAKRTGRWHGSEVLESANELSGIMQGMCQRFGIRCEPIARVSVMWKITGKQSWGSSQANKEAVMRGLKTMKMIDQGCTDDDLADAVAIHVVGSAKFAKKAPANFGLFA
jgi:hypothetical protein